MFLFVAMPTKQIMVVEEFNNKVNIGLGTCFEFSIFPVISKVDSSFIIYVYYDTILLQDVLEILLRDSKISFYCCIQ